MNCSPNRRDVAAQDELHDLARIQGGNWNMQGFRRSSHDEGECQMSIAEFIDDTQGRHLIVERFRATVSLICI
jgi:hypothetical protein